MKTFKVAFRCKPELSSELDNQFLKGWTRVGSYPAMPTQETKWLTQWERHFFDEAEAVSTYLTLLDGDIPEDVQLFKAEWTKVLPA